MLRCFKLHKYSNSFIRNISKISKAHLSHLRLFRNTSHERLKTLCGTLKNMVEYEGRLNVDIHFNYDPAKFKNVKCLLFNGNVSRMIKVDDNQQKIQSSQIKIVYENFQHVQFCDIYKWIHFLSKHMFHEFKIDSMKKPLKLLNNCTY